MTYFILFYDVVDDFPAKGTPFRAQHLQKVQVAHDRGELLMAGALAEPADGRCSSFALATVRQSRNSPRRSLCHNRRGDALASPALDAGHSDALRRRRLGETLMIIRVWTALTTEEDQHKYYKHFREHVLPALVAIRARP